MQFQKQTIQCLKYPVCNSSNANNKHNVRQSSLSQYKDLKKVKSL